MPSYTNSILSAAEGLSPELKRALERHVLRTLGPVSGGLAIAFAVLIVLSLAESMSLGATLTVLASNLVSVGCLFLLYLAWRQRMIPAHRANLAGLCVVVLSLANILIAFALAGKPFYLGYLSIVVLTCGSVLLSPRWLFTVLGLTAFSSAPLAWKLLSPDDFLHYGLVLAAASALAVIVLLTRRSSVLRTQGALASARQESAKRRQMEASLHASERRLELAIAGSQGGWWDIKMDPSTPDVLPDSISLDPSIKRFIGFEDEEFPNSLREWRHRIHPDDLEAYSAAATDHLTGKTPLYEIEYRVRHKDGGTRWIYTRGRIQRDRQGGPLRWSGIDWDITDSKQTKDRLHLLTHAVEQSPSLVIITDTKGAIEYVNPKFTRTTGYSPQEVLGKNPSLFKSGLTPPDTHRELWLAITEGREWQGEFRNRKKDGSSYWVISSISPIRDAAGVTRHYLSVQEDITDRKKVEARLLQSQKMETVGQLVSGVAHDFNNLLTAVIGFSELGLRQLSAGAPLHRELTEIKKAGDSAGELTQQLLAFSRRQMLEPRVLDLNAVVADMELLLRRTISEDIGLELALASNLGATRVDPDQMRQVLLNLAVNARDAMTAGGCLTIETKNVELDGRQSFGTAVPEAGSYVLLAVSDTGHGIDEEVQKRVFEPFFTTKPRDRGTGLGLSTVYGVVKQSGGFISLYSEPDLGTSFKIYIPRVREDLEPQQPETRAETRSGGETILVVEDNAGVRKVAARTLKAQGYRVFSCAEAQEAVRVFTQEDIDLLLTDVVMPGTNGATLALDLTRRSPSLRVLLMSGYTERSLLESQGLDPSTPFLSKPFRLDDLLTKVTQCFETAH